MKDSEGRLLPTWYSKRIEINLPVEKIVEGPFEEEVAISFQSNSEVTSALVPTASVDRTNNTVQALVVGEAGEHCLAVLPGTSYGSTIALIPINKVSELAISPVRSL